MSLETETNRPRRTRTLSAKGQASRQGIIDGAMRVIARDGLDGTSLGAVASESGTSKPAVLYHFGSREHLLRSVARSAIERLFATLTEVTQHLESDGCGEAHARAACEALFVPEQFELLRCLHELIGLGLRDAELGSQVQRVFESLARYLEGQYDEPRPQGVLERCRAVVSSIYGHVPMWLCSDGDLGVRASAIRSTALLGRASLPH